MFALQRIISLFKKKGELAGTITIADLPAFLGYQMLISLFRVRGPDTPSPFDDVDPPESRQDKATLDEEIHFDREDATGSLASNFRLHRPLGWYYLELTVILYRKNGEKTFAQVERFPFVKRPVELPHGGQEIVLPVSWPAAPIEELEHYGTMKPGGGGRLFRDGDS